VKGLSILALCLWPGLLGAADEATVRAEVDARKLGVQDQVQLTLTLEGAAVRLSQEVATPPLQNLRVAAGPFLSTRVSFVNGDTSQQRIYTWVLQPNAVGKAEVGAISVKLQGGEKTTAPISLEVVPGNVRPRAQQRADPMGGGDPFGGEDPFDRFFGRGRQGGGRRAEPKLFIEAAPSRKRLHVGEPLLLTYYVYTQTSISDIQFSDAPQYPGFWSEELDRGRGDPQGESASVEGEAYRRFPIFQRLLFPTKAGRLELPAATLKVGIPRQSFFDAGAAVERSTKPLVIEVDPIPEEPGFSGAVGRFRASSSLDKTSLPLGEAATLRFRVEGSGNLKWIDKPPEVRIPGAKVYPPTTSSDLKPGTSGITGSKTWEFVVVPETAGALEVPALAFPFFDPATGKLARAETPAIPLHVDPGAAGAAMPLPAAPGAVRSRGALALRSELDLPRQAIPDAGPLTVAVGLGFALLLHAGLWGGPLVADRLRAARGRPAPRRHVRSALADIQHAGRDRMSKEAAAALLEKALHEVFGAVDEAAPSQDGERERAARSVLQEVQFLRYAPQLGDYSEKIREVAARAAEVVRRWA
jgi:hypothetical protein